ncbi:MAG TPA: 2'-5' RNA ligase family protein [Saprospiraceae bacterium]|nr:2'-5' RNA ligase family protein [Saprospiraceae bacterium]HND87053.1 2'-5' RNA ligase family protein [Saprospiraceae bacterium]HNG89016.1 2'-5' RNA ligase family protein [Saprospiraceae bacterium]
MSVRHQLSLFATGPEAALLEGLRQRFNPAQHALIAAHVTLCREDELEPLPQLLHTLRGLRAPVLSLQFGPPLRFHEGRGVLLPAQEPCKAFHDLRRKILAKEGATNPRHAAAHLTLMHPRNAACTAQIWREISGLSLPTSLTFSRISLIRQTDGGVWELLEEFGLG